MTDAIPNPARRRLSLAAAALCAVPGWARAAPDWPARPIRIVVPFAAGISPDIVARLVGDALVRTLGQPVLVDNRAGAAGMIGAEAAARSPADGYTVFMSVESIVGVLPHIYSRLPYDHFRDFVPVTQVVQVPYFLVTAPGSALNSLPAVLAQARDKPGSIDFASLGVGSGAHVRMAMFNSLAGVRMNHVPYKGSPLADLMGGQIALVFEPATTALPLIKAGKLRALAVTSAQPHPLAPEVPPVASLLPGYRADGWQGFFVPRGTPQEVVATLNTHTVRALRHPDVAARIAQLGLQAVGNTAEEFAAITRSEYEKWGKVARDNDIRVE